jgi:hypothetical protein
MYDMRISKTVDAKILQRNQARKHGPQITLKVRVLYWENILGHHLVWRESFDMVEHRELM